jgi:hypothetical protein
MSDVIDLPLDDDDRLVEPPLLDLLYHDEAQDAYVVTFVPTDEVSQEATEVVRIRRDFPEYRRVDGFFKRVEELVGGGRRIVRIVHQGGGNFAFHFLDGSAIEMADRANEVSQEASDRLKQIADAAEMAFRVVVRG